MTRTMLMLATCVMATGCATTPTVSKQKMALADADLTGLECRTEKPINSNKPQTVCASPSAWKAWEEKQKRETDQLLDETRSIPNRRFGGP